MDDPPATASAVFDRAGRHQTVYLAGDLDQSTAPALSADILRHVLPTDDVLWVDLSDVTFCGSAGVSMLVRLAVRAERLDVHMRLYNPPNVVMRVLDVCELVDHFAIWSTTSS